MEQPPDQQTPSPQAFNNFGMVPSQEEKTNSMLCWILTIFAGFIPGLIFFMIANEKPFLKRQASLSLTLSIVTVVGMVISAILMVVLIGIVTYILFFLFALYVCIMGAVATNKGENYNPPLITSWNQKLFKL